VVLPVATGSPTRSPRRTCIGCRRVTHPDELVRLRWTGSDLAVGRGPGRGAWLCRTTDGCLERAVRRGAVERALRVTIPNLDLADLRARLTAASPPGTVDGARTGPDPTEEPQGSR
jgi:predicted RNA-binding protein YlxR (DUF448 family)